MPISPDDIATAPCLTQGPLSAAAPELLMAARDLGSGRPAANLRALASPFLINAMERVFDADVEPGAELRRQVETLARWYRGVGNDAWRDVEGGIVRPADRAAPDAAAAGRDVEQTTGEHFGRLFADFAAESFWRQPHRPLQLRLERNGVDLALFKGKDVLDAGCGSGRLCFVFHELGARRVVGIDIAEAALDLARRRQQEVGARGVEFEAGSVLALPYPDESFDVVFSNGVFHHTTDWRRAVSEFVRVLKPGGTGLLYYLNEQPGGLFWDVLELLRAIVKGDPLDWMRDALTVYGLPGPRIIYLLDALMVPINERLTPESVEQTLRAAKASGVRRFTRGADRDRLERVYQREPYAADKFGVGENRYVFTKG